MTYYLYIPSFTNHSQPTTINNFDFTHSKHNTSIFFNNQEFNLSETFSISQPTISDQIYLFQQPEYNSTNQSKFKENQEMFMEIKESKKRERNFDKEVESAKKNSESNLINQFFSFFSSRERSESTVEACVGFSGKKECQKEKLVHLFYNTIHIINARRGRKYVNRKIILSLFEVDVLLKTVPEIKEKVEKVNDVAIEELCELFRRCTFAFYRSHCINSVLTSKRILRVAKEEHFKKRRKVVSGLFKGE